MRTIIKKTIAFALTLCAITAGTIAPNAGKLALSPTPIVAEAAQIGDFVFTRRSVAAATLTSYTGTASSVTLPTEVTINGAKCKITGIDGNAFFGNTYIRSVTIPSGYTNISGSSFMYCSNLSSISIPSTIVAIGNNAFMGTAITSFTIPSKVKMLGESVFNGCTKLKTVNIKTTILTELKNGLFCGCTSLTSVNIPSSIKKLGNNFAYGCTSLTSITIPSSVTTIDLNAFAECTRLSSISLPSSVTEFGGNAFKNTPWLKNQPRTSGLVIKNRVAIDASKASGTVNIPSGVTKLSCNLFQNNNNITKVVMPSSLEILGTEAFSGCKNLTTVQLSNYISEIPANCFSDCSKLSSITLTNRIQTLGTGAFSYCTSLKSINFPEHLKTVGFFAFNNCSALENISGINFNNSYNIDGQAFENCMKLKKLNGNTVASRSGYNVSIYQSNFVKKYFSQTDNIGFIQDFIDKKTGAVVDQIKSQHPNYNQTQMARALEEWMCANGCNPFEKWKSTYGNTNYPDDIENRKEYHRESSVLMNGVGVCEGWAKGYYRLLKKAGIWSEITAGNNHNYNAVNLDGMWFNVDTYWDDNGNSASYKWFLVSDAEAKAMDDSRRCHNTSGTLDPDNDYTYSSYYPNCNHPIGDVNLDCVLDKNDYDIIYKYVYNNYRPKTFHMVCADMNFDGKINATDVNLLKQKANIR
ncbi:MAG: leucine-rich repeat protein [Ruminococcus sp.]|nr:leucine-rich repeat protein [Ruminococcus sp.]